MKKTEKIIILLAKIILKNLLKVMNFLNMLKFLTIIMARQKKKLSNNLRVEKMLYLISIGKGQDRLEIKN